MLSERQNEFLVNRRKLIKVWNYAGVIILVILIGFGVYMFFNTPLLINPFEVLIQLEEQTIEYSTLKLMAIMLPIIFATACFLLFVIVATMYTVFANEKKYLEIVERLKKNTNAQ